jgi:leader peptidase (prepilin peptidase)/N-methyltransferase
VRASLPEKLLVGRWFSSRGNDSFAFDRRTILIFAATAVPSAVASLASAPGLLGVAGAGLAIVVTTIAIVDWRKFVIPDWLNAVGFALALVNAALQEPDAQVTAMISVTLRGVAIALVFLAIRYGYALLRGRPGLGLGDVKLAGVAGAWLDWAIIPIAIELAAFAALTAYLIPHVLRASSISLTKRLPFGTFLAPAIWVTWLLEVYLLASVYS